MIGQYKGSNPTNPPIFYKTKVNYDMDKTDNTLPKETNDLIQMTIAPILVIAKMKLRVKPDPITLINQIPKTCHMSTQIHWTKRALAIQFSITPLSYYTNISQ